MRYLASKSDVTLKTGLGFVLGHWLEMAPFDRSHTSSYSPSIVTMAICLAISEIFSVKEWRDLGNQVRGRSSLKVIENGAVQ